MSDNVEPFLGTVLFLSDGAATGFVQFVFIFTSSTCGLWNGPSYRPGIQHGAVEDADSGLGLLVRAHAAQQFLFRVVSIGSEPLRQNKTAGLDGGRKYK